MQGISRIVAAVLMVAGGWCAIDALPAWGQTGQYLDETRKPKTKVAPIYPDLARRMNINGVVKVMVTVAPNGTVKDAKLVGGHPVLANAALDAVKKWRFEVSPQESTGVVEFRFDSGQ
jgi:TonB family protein